MIDAKDPCVGWVPKRNRAGIGGDLLVHSICPMNEEMARGCASKIGSPPPKTFIARSLGDRDVDAWEAVAGSRPEPHAAFNEGAAPNVNARRKFASGDSPAGHAFESRSLKPAGRRPSRRSVRRGGAPGRSPHQSHPHRDAAAPRCRDAAMPRCRDAANQAHRLAPGATCSIVNTMPSTAKVARVAVSDEQWRAFRQAALTQGISVSTYLARLRGGRAQAPPRTSCRRGRPRGRTG